MRSARSGQSLIEVMFATLVIAMALIALLSSVIASLRNSRVSMEQTAATKYGEEVLEWFRRARDEEGWGRFYSSLDNRTTGNALTYCLTTLPASFTALMAAQQGVCAEQAVIPSTIFRRQVTLTLLTPSTINVLVEVIWPGRTGDVSTNLQSQLGDWDQ